MGNPPPTPPSIDAGGGLRIGMICPGYPTGAPGDYRGIFVRHMVQALKARGHRVCVLTSRIRPEDTPYVRVDDAEEVCRFWFWSEGKLLIEYPRIPVARMTTYMLSAFYRGLREFRRFGCDIIHSHFLLPTGLLGATLAAALRRPHVVSIHGSDMRLATGKRLMAPLARWTLRHSGGGITAAAHHQLEGLQKLGADLGRVVMLPMGIGEAFVRQTKEGAADGAYKIISTRTLREDLYNISQLIRAMKVVAARDPRVTCTIAGDGPDRAKLEELARSLGLGERVIFSGWATPERLAEQLAEHQVYVSASRADGASSSLFEAMACGAFPVVSDIPANREWIRDGENGRIFPLDKPEALAETLLETLNGTHLIQQATELNRSTARSRFTWEGIARTLEELYSAPDR